jgi:outer membrane receptor for ferrienterochelin and colicin
VAGLQYVKEKFTRNAGYSENLTPGGTTLGSGSNPQVSEATTIAATAGFFAEQTISYKERLYLTGAVRSDKNSAFGASFQRVFYPKAGVSYVLSDEAFFPKGSALSSLRLRGSYGASGRQPGPNDALPFFGSLTANVDGVDSPGLVISSLGNDKIKPERTAEVELGFDAGLANGKVSFEFTYYKKTSKERGHRGVDQRQPDGHPPIRLGNDLERLLQQGQDRKPGRQSTQPWHHHLGHRGLPDPGVVAASLHLLGQECRWNHRLVGADHRCRSGNPGSPQRDIRG